MTIFHRLQWVNSQKEFMHVIQGGGSKCLINSTPA